MGLEEVRIFREEFLPAYDMTLDELQGEAGDGENS